MAGSGMAAMGNVEGGDVDSDDTLSYAVGTQASHGTLEVDEMTGAWTYMVNEDDAAVQALGAGETAMDMGTIVISDDQGGSAEVEVEITITGIVDAPVVSAMSADVNENDMSGPNLIEVSSPDTGVTFSVDNDKFEIDTVGSASVLKLKDGMYLDHEGTDGMVTLMITASDGTTTSAATEVTINVGDVNEAPMISVMDSETPDTVTAAASIMENAAGVPVGEIMVSDYDMADADLSGMITVSDDRFEVSEDAEGGLWLKLKDGVSLDHETDPMVTVTVGVTDTGTNGMAMSASTDVVVTVGNVNEDPMISVVDSMTPDGMPARSNIPENQAGVPVGEIMISDPDMADNMLGEDDITLSGDHAMYFEVKTDDMGGIWLKLKDGVSLNYEEMSSVMVTVTVTDSGMATAMDTVTVTVGNVNEPPSISVGEAMIDENTTGRVGLVTVSDNEEMRDITLDVEDIEVVGVGSPFRVIEDEMGHYVLELTRPIDFESDEVMKIDDFTGTVEVVLQVTDAGGLTDRDTVAVVINNVDEAPMISVEDDGDAVSSIAENSNADAEVVVGRIDASDPEGGDFDMNGVMLSGADKDSFYVNPDDEDVLWLVLKPGVSADYEGDGGSLAVTLTVEDGTNAAESTDFTLTLVDVNEKPVSDDAKSDELMGTTLSWVVDNDATKNQTHMVEITGLFSDEDAQDGNLVYTVEGGPGWLKDKVIYDDDRTYIELSGEPSPSDVAATWSINLVATDHGGLRETVALQMVADDGNDIITDVDLLDENGKAILDVEVDEKDSSGMVFGEIKVFDQDPEEHVNGMHLIQILAGVTDSESPSARTDDRFEVRYDDEGLPWLALREGAELNYENTDGRGTVGFVDVTIRAVDMNGATKPASQGGGFAGELEFQTIRVLVNDKNDAPEDNAIGNWWVTVEEGLRPEEVSKGLVLDFSLEIDGDKNAFSDPDGDPLTYSLSGPTWLEIDSKTGRITNTEGGAPVRGVHDVTVTAMDPDGEEASAKFRLSVAYSDPDGNFTEDNEEPVIRVMSEVDYDEGSGEHRVATFTVRDDDNDLEHHPFALDSVRITAVVDDDDPDNANGQNRLDDSETPGNEAQGTSGFGGAFRLSDPIKNGDTWTYHVYVRDTNPATSGPNHDSTAVLDFEQVDRISITIRAEDGITTVDEEITVRIDDVNEKPMAADIGGATDTNVQSGDYGVAQSETLKEVLYIKLEDLWTDPEGDSPDDLTYTVSTSGSWIKVLHHPAEWGDIMEGRNTRDDIDDLQWGGADINGELPGGIVSAVIIGGSDSGTVTDGDLVAIIEIDRTGRNNGQNDQGSFTITATDRDGATGSKTYKIMPEDQNLLPSPGAVTLSGSPREGATLRANFNDDRDPDLAGAAKPALVLYQWYTVDSNSDEDLIAQGTSNSYTPTQSDVGKSIRVKVKYYEVGAEDSAGQLVGFDVASGLTQATTSRVVSNLPDVGSGEITIFADGNVLSVPADSVRVTDGDYSTPGNLVADANLDYSWEVSDNGRGGWTTVNQGDDADKSTLELPDGKGKHYRAVVTYDANDDLDGDATASVYSNSIQVSDVRNTAPTVKPNINGNAFVGGTLSVEAPSNASVQWQTKVGTDWVDIEGATGSLSLTQAHAGATVRAVVTYHSTNARNPGVTAVVDVEANDGQPIPGGTGATARPVAVDDHDIEVSVGGTGHNPIPGGDNNAGHNLSITREVPLASLFQDPDTAHLTFKVAPGSNSGLGSDANAENSEMDGTYVFDQAEGGVLVFEAKTGKLTFNSDVYRMHDGDDTDGTLGGSNVLTLNITANDGQDSETMAAVNLRINVAPTEVEITDMNGDAVTNNTISVNEHLGSGASARPAGDVIAMLDVMDENSKTHKFGTHNIELSGDDRFVVVHNGYTGRPGSRDSDGDGSTWEIRLKPGAKLDFESQSDMDSGTDGKQIVLTLTVTDGGGLSTRQDVKLTITLNDLDRVEGDTNHPKDPVLNNVPGLDDDENDPNDERKDDDDAGGEDDDADGGAHPSTDMGMMLTMLDDGLF